MIAPGLEQLGFIPASGCNDIPPLAYIAPDGSSLHNLKAVVATRRWIIFACPCCGMTATAIRRRKRTTTS